MHRKFSAVTHCLNVIAFVFAECFSYHQGPISDGCNFIKTTRGGGNRMPQTLVYKTSEGKKVGTTRWPLQVQVSEICIRSLGNFVDHLECVPWRKAYFQRCHLPRCSFLFQYEATLTSGPVDSTYIYTIPSVTFHVLHPLTFLSGHLAPGMPRAPNLFWPPEMWSVHPSWIPRVLSMALLFAPLSHHII